MSGFVMIRRHSIWIGAAILAFCALALVRSVGQAQTSPYTPYQHRALYLYNFAKYTEWPKETFTDTNAPFVLGILGEDPFGKGIEVIKDKMIKGRKLEIKHCKTVQEAAGCQLLFISSSETKNLSNVLKALDNSSVLTVAEVEGFIQQSGLMINLVPEEKGPGLQTLGFEINQAAAEKANLKFDTQLLRLAKKTS
jgi:hypothetical protein